MKCVAIITVVFLSFLLGCGNSPEDTVNGYMSATRSGDLDALLDYYPALDDVIGHLSRSEAEELLPGKPDLEWRIIESELAVNGNSALISVETSIASENITAEELEVSLVMRNGKWVITNIINFTLESTAQEVHCRSNLRSLGSAEAMFYGAENRYGTIAEIVSLEVMENAGLITCPTCARGYSVTISDGGNSYRICCPCNDSENHGSIEDGIVSW